MAIIESALIRYSVIDSFLRRGGQGYSITDLVENRQVQFKERMVNQADKYEIGCEMVAFSNSLYL